MTTREIAIQCLKDEAQAILDLIPKMDEDFERAVDMIMDCKGKVIVTGVGKSGTGGESASLDSQLIIKKPRGPDRRVEIRIAPEHLPLDRTLAVIPADLLIRRVGDGT